jgi:hypothetical protein
MSDSQQEMQSKAVGLLAKFKSDFAGMRMGIWEQERDARFCKIASELLADFKDEDSAAVWLNSPCTCNECQYDPLQFPRADFLNSEFGFRHLLRNIKATREEIWLL